MQVNKEQNVNPKGSNMGEGERGVGEWEKDGHLDGAQRGRGDKKWAEV